MRKCFCIMIITPICYGYENESFKIDIPSNYIKFEYGSVYMFVNDTDEKDMGVSIFMYESKGLKKNIDSISNSEIRELANKAAGSSGEVNIVKQGKEKIGKHKAIEILSKTDDGYVEVYLLASDDHIFMVCFVGNTIDDINSKDFKEIKKSFKIKEKITNPTLIKVFVLLGVLAAVVFVMQIRNRRN